MLTGRLAAARRWRDAIALGVLLGVWIYLSLFPWDNDAHTFWSAWSGPMYPAHWSPTSHFVYSPAFAQAFWPLTFIPWPVVHALWTGVQLLALTWMLGPVWAAVALGFPLPHLDGYGPAVYSAVANGNPVILVAAAIVLGLRYPSAWSFVLLTKVSAGVCVVYFLVRGEWRNLAIALGTTTTIATLSFIIAPNLWREWIGILFSGASLAGGHEAMLKEPFMPIPLAIRGPLGLAVVALAGRAGWPWLVPIGCFLALPDIHLGGFALLVAVPALWLRRHDPVGHVEQRVDGSRRTGLRHRPDQLGVGRRSAEQGIERLHVGPPVARVARVDVDGEDGRAGAVDRLLLKGADPLVRRAQGGGAGADEEGRDGIHQPDVGAHIPCRPSAGHRRAR